MRLAPKRDSGLVGVADGFYVLTRRVEVVVASRVSTAWLSQGLSQGVCPLCLLAGELDRECVSSLADACSSQHGTKEALVTARWFCAEHAQQLTAVVNGPRSAIDGNELFAAAVEMLARDLAELEDDAWLERCPCAACEYRDDGVVRGGQLLLGELAYSEAFRAAYRESAGVCASHFGLLWDTSLTELQRALIRAVALRTAERVVADLRDQRPGRRRHRRDGRSGGESGVVERAIWLTWGWSERSGARGAENDGPSVGSER